MSVLGSGEVARGFPCVSFATADAMAALDRRGRALMAIMSAKTRGEPISVSLLGEAWESKRHLFRVMGWGEPRRDWEED